MSVESCVTIRSQILQRLATTSGHGIEDTALSLLALRNSGADPHALLGTQHRSGAWSALPDIEPLSAFHTALALLAIRPFQTSSVRQAAERAFEWLSELRGLESHWLWQWKFRLFDKQVRFDPSKSGWPWVPGTVSWVAPTALSVLAFRAWHRESLAHRACGRHAAGSGMSSRRMERRQFGCLRGQSRSTSRLHRDGSPRIARLWPGLRDSVEQISELPCHSPRRIFFSILSGLGGNGAFGQWSSRRRSSETPTRMLRRSKV